MKGWLACATGAPLRGALLCIVLRAAMPAGPP